jgi:hypothetical protein
MKSVKILAGQTMLDIALQELGDLERVFEMAVDNNISISDNLQAGSVLQVGDYERDKRYLIKIFEKPTKIASDDFAGEVNSRLEGVDYWTLGMDFIVQ